MNLDDVRQLTMAYGEGWGYSHACRLLKLVDLIGDEVTYDATALRYAIYLHDWGAFPRYVEKGVDHAERSRQVAEAEILGHTDLSESQIGRALEAIALHDYRDMRPVSSAEALLLREADFLDFLGVIGMVREFAWGPNNLATCLTRILARQAGIRDRFTLPKAKMLAAQRLARMEQLLIWLREESFGVL
jgi:uncharacterized protein